MIMNLSNENLNDINGAKIIQWQPDANTSKVFSNYLKSMNGMVSSALIDAYKTKYYAIPDGLTSVNIDNYTAYDTLEEARKAALSNGYSDEVQITEWSTDYFNDYLENNHQATSNWMYNMFN